MLDRLSRRASIALVAALACLAELPALGAGFILDDRTLLIDNPYVRSLAGLRTLVTREFFHATAHPENAAQYRPVSGALNWLAWHLLGASAVAQHACNILLHAAVASLAFVAMETLGAARLVALTLSMLVAVHPVAALATGYVEGRQDLVAWLLVLGALIAIVRLRRPWGAAPIAFFGVLLATHCREPFVGSGLLLTVAALARAERPRLSAILTASGAAGAIATTLLLRRLVGVTAYDSPPFTLAALLEGAAGVLLRLSKDVVAPTDLALLVTAPSVGVAGGLLLLLAALAGYWAFDRWLARLAPHARPLAACGAASLASIAALHAIVVVQFGPISDRYAYAAVLALAFLGAAALEAAPRPWPRVATVVPLALALAIVPLTWARAATFRDEATLQATMIEERPDDPESRIAVGFGALADGDLERAYPHCAAYAAARPASRRADGCIGTWLLAHGQPVKALSLLRPYALARPGYPLARRAAFAAAFAANELATVRELLDAFAPFAAEEDYVEAAEELERRTSRR